MQPSSPLAVIAVGGNSLIQDNDHPQVRHQWDAVRKTTGHIADLVEAGWRVVITHGNGPQVGFILRRNELAAAQVHTTPLSLIVADTQGSIGYMLQQGMHNEMQERGISFHCVTLLTQVLVDGNDPAFAKPSKPIGGFLTEDAAQRFAETGWHIVEDAGRGWRRVIASPEPQQIMEEAAIRQALELNWIVIACGGGGIPVVRNPQGELRGVSAVIDKDLASSLLAARLQADLFLISTGVEKVALNFGQPNQVNLEQLTLTEAQSYQAAGQFAAGSMGPKIEACVRFLTQTTTPHARAMITNPDNLARAVAGETGTVLIRR